MNKTNDFKYNLPAYSDPVDIEDLNDNFRGIDDALMAGLCKKDYTGNNMGSSDPSQRKYAWAPWLEIVNDNEFDVVVTDRNAPVGSEEATINIAAGQTFRKYINGRYYMNFYVQDQYDVTFKWFTNAETYINESGGGGGGTGTVTSVSVQGGSGSHLTGTGNPIETSGTITINVDEGYSIPQTLKQEAWDAKAADLKAEVDSSTYVMTLQLKDSAGNLIGGEKTIDLPLETMVVDGEYDPLTKKIKLELKNGNYVEFSVADLVSGLQTELSASNKLDPDYIDYDSSHIAVSDTDKNTWNGKQNALTFDDTPTQNSNNPVKSGGVYSALTGKQASLDQAQLAAVNSGIDSTKVAQISTNQTNILSVLDADGQKNYACQNSASLTTTESTGGWVIAQQLSFVKPIAANTPVQIDFDYTTSTHINEDLRLQLTDSQGLTLYETRVYSTGTDGHISETVVPAVDVYGYTVRFEKAGTATVSNIMICPKSLFDISPSYVPYALPNYDLTQLEAEDRAALAEEIDAGAKNKFDISTAQFDTYGGTIGVTYNSGSSATIKQVSGGTSLRFPGFITRLEKGTYVLSGCPSGGSDSTYRLDVRSWSGSSAGDVIPGSFDYGSGSDPFTITTAGNYIISTRFASGYTVPTAGITVQPMICTKAAFGISKAFVPYRLPNNNLGYKTYEINLSAVTINKAGSGVYWYKISVSSDFSKVVSVTLTDGKEIPNKRSFMPYVENGTGGAQAIGFLIADPDAPATMTFNDGAYMSLTAFGYLK